ncbi:MAG: TIM barrel protein [Thermodesulfobacteriota bacterium]|nr:TIM barrel protein [Thermodesulfobacteriota bacterium]
MLENMYQMMQIGVVHFKAYPGIERGEGPILETLEKICADDFWTAVEVGWMRDYRVLNTARNLLDQSHLTVCYATQPKVLSLKLNLNSFDVKERNAAISSVKSCVDEAYDLGASVIRLIAGQDPGDAKREEAKKLLVDSLQQIMEYGKGEGQIDFTLKIFDRDIDKKNLIGHFKDALDVARALRPSFPNFGLLADLSHFPLLRERPEDAIPLIKDYLVSAHLGNCVCADKRHPAYGDIQPRFGLPGGEIDLPEVIHFFRVLKANDFFNKPQLPIVSAEVRPVLAGEISEIVLANTKRVIRQAWALA